MFAFRLSDSFPLSDYSLRLCVAVVRFFLVIGQPPVSQSTWLFFYLHFKKKPPTAALKRCVSGAFHIVKHVLHCAYASF